MGATYSARHTDLWLEFREAIRAHGSHNYSTVFLPDVDRVVEYIEVDDLNRGAAGNASELTRSWWQYMGDLMPTNVDGSPIQSPIFEVFLQD